MAQSACVLFPPKALTRSGTCKMPRELVLRLKIAQGPCPDATRRMGLFVYSRGTCRPKWLLRLLHTQQLAVWIFLYFSIQT